MNKNNPSDHYDDFNEAARRVSFLLVTVGGNIKALARSIEIMGERFEMEMERLAEEMSNKKE